MTLQTLDPGALAQHRRLLARAVVLAGAGVSAESGIPTLRDALEVMCSRVERPVIVVDPNPTEPDGLASVCLRGRAVSVVPEILPSAAPPDGATGP